MGDKGILIWRGKIVRGDRAPLSRGLRQEGAGERAVLSGRNCGSVLGVGRPFSTARTGWLQGADLEGSGTSGIGRVNCQAGDLESWHGWVTTTSNPVDTNHGARQTAKIQFM